MQQQWFVRRGNKEEGPLTPQQLKQMPKAGSLHASDFVRTLEKPNWRPAGSVKGLFEEHSASASSTLPPQGKAEPPKVGGQVVDGPPSAPTSSSVTADESKSGLTGLLNTAKQAKDLGFAQARKTQITQMTLPNAYLALGREVFEVGNFSEQFSELFQQVASTNNEIAKASAGGKNESQPADLKGKLQAGAAQLVAKGQVAVIGRRRDSLMRELGQKAFEAHGKSAGSPEVIGNVTKCISEVEALNQEIARLAGASRGDFSRYAEWATQNKKILAIVGGSSGCMLLLCCGGLGLLGMIAPVKNETTVSDSSQVQNASQDLGPSQQKTQVGKAINLSDEDIEDLIDNPDKYAGKVLVLTAMWHAKGSLRDDDGFHVPFSIGGAWSRSKRRHIPSRDIKIRISSHDLLAEFKSLNELPNLSGHDNAVVKIIFDDFENCRLLTLKRK